MTTQVSTKVRLVRCPKCRQVLAELPEVLLYKCGGCGTILQAKNRKVESNGAALSSQETGSVAKSQQDNDLEEEARSSNHDTSSPPKVESSPDKDNIRCQDEDRSVSEGLSSSREVTSCQNEDSPVEVQESLKDDNPFDQGRYDSKFHVENQENGVDQMEGGEPERVLQDGKNFVGENENSSKSMEQITNASANASQSPLNGSLVSFYLSSSDDEHLDHFSRENTRNFERVSSVDTLGSSPLAEVTSELNFGHRSMTRYPSYYTYDGSESSYDGTNDQIHEHISHPSRKSKIIDYNNSTEMLRKDRFRVGKSEPESGNSHRTVRYPSHEHNLLLPRRGFSSSDKHSYSDNMDLLRTVCELKDQLDRMHFPKVTTNRRFQNYDHFPPERGTYTDHPNAYDRKNISRLAFSDEASHYRHHVRCSCLHCCPQDWPYSAQLPENGHRVVHTDQNCCNISSSDEIKRLHLKEKHQTVKRRLLRPIAGGAPVVACYHCSELLQLPIDFLLFKKRYHQLMCNACKKILKFSLVKGTHIVPYLPEASAPPPSEADEYNDASQNAESVSYSDDYGRSFCRSFSTEGSYDPIEDRKMKSILKETEKKKESFLKSVESAESLRKMPKWKKTISEIEEVPLSSSNSPLHQLMGYSSPSNVLHN